MKIIKKNYLLTALALSVMLIGCDDEVSEEVTQNADSITSEIEKIETAYVEGAEKIENIFDGNKIETLLDDHLIDEIKNAIEIELEKSVTKTHSNAKITYPVGVFRDYSCGGHSQLRIFMDAEDRNASSSKSGYTGASSVDYNNRNVTLELCIVDGASFTHFGSSAVTYPYAVLALSNNRPSHAGIFTRFFDNEDRNNNNKTLINNVTKIYQYGDNIFNKNTLLNFYYYGSARNVRETSLPNFGFSYYVLGQFGAFKGTIFVDDEDSRNANWHKYVDYRGITQSYNGNIIMDTGANTRLKFSRAIL